MPPFPLRLVLLLVLGWDVWARPLDSATLIYVSVNGSDSGEGSPASPFRTLERAQQAARVSPRTTPTTVLISPGTYYLHEQASAPFLKFTPEDSGASMDASVSYVGDGTGEVRLSGGRRVQGAWTTADAKIWSTNLPEAPSTVDQLWMNDQRQHVARTPMLTYKLATDTTVTFSDGSALPPQGVSLEQARMVMYETWTMSYHVLRGINYSNKTVLLGNPYETRWNGASGNRSYLENVASLLDTPGEFFYNASTHVLQWYGAPGIDPNTAEFVYAGVMEVVVVQGDTSSAGGAVVQYVNFANISIVHAAADFSNCLDNSCSDQSTAFLGTAAVHVSGAQHVNFAFVQVAHVGGYGVWFDQGSQFCSLSHSHVFDLGAGGVRIGRDANNLPAYQRTENVAVTDNVLEQGGRIYQSGCGVLAQAVANTTIAHNLITDFFYTGVSVGWSWGYAQTSTHDNVVAYNAINTIGQSALSDMGCIYTLGIQYGSAVINNVCHSVFSYNYGGWGYYTDEGSTDILWTNNIAFHTKCAGHHQHYGMANLLTNNVYADVNAQGCDATIRHSQHAGHTTDCAHIHPGEDQGQCSSFIFRTNIVYAPNNTLLSSAVPYGFANVSTDLNTYYRVYHPEAIEFPTNETLKTFAAWQRQGHDVHGGVSDPMFDGGEENDFSKLLPSSPALQRGFHPIDISTVGPRASSVPGVSPSKMADLMRHALYAPSLAMSPRPAWITDEEREGYERAWEAKAGWRGTM